MAKNTADPKVLKTSGSSNPPFEGFTIKQFTITKVLQKETKPQGKRHSFFAPFFVLYHHLI